MKRFFTLLELMIVVAVIAVLIGLVGANLPAFMTGMKVTQARKDMNTLAIAVKAFEAEYQRLPLPENTTREVIDPNRNSGDLERYRQFIATIAGKTEYAGKRLNEVQIKKSNYREKSFWKIPPNYSQEDYDLKDPWGNYYVIWFDFDGDGKINSRLTGAGSCVFWSYGPGAEKEEAETGSGSFTKIANELESRAKTRKIDGFVWDGKDGIIASWIEKRNEDNE